MGPAVVGVTVRQATQVTPGHDLKPQGDNAIDLRPEAREAGTPVSQLIATGWGHAKAAQRHHRYAVALDGHGVQWKPATSADLPAVHGLVGAHIRGLPAGWQMGADAGAVVAFDPQGSVIGCAVVGAADFDGRAVMFLQHLVVEPHWRGRGVGAVTLGLLHQMLPSAGLVATVGNCAAEDARFYQHAGFTVFQPGEPLELPVGAPVRLVVSNAQYPCWMVRSW